MSVRDWPTYLLRDIPPGTRLALEIEAGAEDRSMIEIIREILCAHYELDCEPVLATARPPKPKPSTDTMILRLQPELWQAIRQEADQQESRYGATDRIIHAILAAHYNGGHPHD